MKVAVYRGPGDIRIEERPDPTIEAPTDAVVRITHTAICGSDLWFYRGDDDRTVGDPVGHEPMGIVEAVGEDVRSVEPGDRVFAPFAISCGTCEFCRQGLHTSCVNGDTWGGEGLGAQGERIRVPLADGTLVRIPDRHADDEGTLEALLPLTDVMGTGHHAAVCADVGPGDTAVVIGDGAVGLCAVLAARRLGAARVIAVGHHEDRLALAEELGATATVAGSGDEAVAAVTDRTNGGARHVLECVGARSAIETAVDVVRPGGSIGYVGVPHLEDPAFLRPLFYRNVSLTGGPAPVRAYAEELMVDVLQGTLDPSPVLTTTVDLEGVPGGYRAMADRETIKVMVRVDG